MTQTATKTCNTIESLKFNNELCIVVCATFEDKAFLCGMLDTHYVEFAVISNMIFTDKRVIEYFRSSGWLYEGHTVVNID